MKKILRRDQIETIICILAFGWLSILCMYIKNDMNIMVEGITNVLK